MEIRKFRGQSMREVLNKVRRELGEDAVILHTRTYYQRDGWRFWRKREWVEITASRDVRILENSPVAKTPRQNIARSYRQVNGLGTHYANRIPGEDSFHIPRHIQALREEIEELKEMTTLLLKRAQFSGCGGGHLTLFEEALEDQEVDRELVQELLSNLSGETEEILSGLRERILSLLSPCEPMKRDLKETYKVALIGPTGVGKTTTIAKLAARYSLLYGKRVGLLTVDTFRIAAVDQLRTYAEIMRLPIEVVVSPQDVAPALSRLADRDVIFVDTAGRSQRNELQMSELRAFLNAISPDEVHLVLSGTSNRRTIKEVLDRFSVVRYDKLLFTKMDETLTPGIILNGRHWTGKPISYITTGQSVPDDIEDAVAEKLADIIEEALIESVGSGTKIA